jgi:anaphase-promoting complex subunit 2
LQQDYEAAFHHFKPDKRLRWLQHIGTAVVKLELEDRVVEVEATPLQASIAELFESQDTWDVQAMSDKLGVDLFQIRNGLVFWANEGVVKEENRVWKLLEVAEEGYGQGESEKLNIADFVQHSSRKRDKRSQVWIRVVSRESRYIGR